VNINTQAKTILVQSDEFLSNSQKHVCHANTKHPQAQQWNF
jgi:hypothetical protein